jgi:hypothetical protein
LDQVDIPDPVKDDEGDNMYESETIRLFKRHPLVARRFTGFCTAGEIARQKRVVVNRTQFDQVELTGTASRTVKPSGT